MDVFMDSARLAELLRPFTTDAVLSPKVFDQLQRYLDLLLRWNARVNLSAVRAPEQVVTRHFGESLFAAQVLLGRRKETATQLSLADVGSGAGFPGIPMQLFAPELELTLIESHNKKATFLREVLRALDLKQAEVFSGRAERWGRTADLVTLRAVEQFEHVLPIAANLVTPGGRLCLLISAAQVPIARDLLVAGWTWQQPIAVPLSTQRVIFVGSQG